MKKVLLSAAIVFLVFASPLVTKAQVQGNSGNGASKFWFDMMQDPDARFRDVQNAFYHWWEQRSEQLEEERELSGEAEEGEEDEVEGVGYQIFKRWEYINKSRVLNDGRLPAPGYVMQQYNQYMSQYDGTSSAGGNWSIVGMSNYPTNNTGQPTGMGRVNAIAFHPTDQNIVFLGAPSGGFFKTTNANGNNTVWTNLSANLPTLGVSSILVNPVNPDIIYLGTGDRDSGDAPGMGVYKSTDGGVTWTAMNTGMGNVTVGAMVMNPNDPNTIIAATSGGIYKTTNGGSSWSQRIAGNFKDIKLKPGDPSTIYAVRIVTPSEFYRSTDTGTSWTKITTIPSTGIGSRMVIGVTPANANVVYLVQVKTDNTFSNLIKSTDSGLSFTAMAVSPPNIMSSNCDGTGTTTQATYDLCIAVDPNNANNVIVGGVDIWKSTDGGATWAIKAIWAGNCSGTAVPVHADHHAFEWSPWNGGLYDGHDGGISYSTDLASTWTEITGALPITQVYKIGQGASGSNYLVFGCQDNGSNGTTNGSSFYTTRGGDGMETLIDYSNSNYCYNTYITSINRSSGGPTGSFSYSLAGNGVNGMDEDGAWVLPYFLHKSDHLTMFAGYKNVWRTNNVTSIPPTWTKISSGETNTCSVLKQSSANVDVIYVVRDDYWNGSQWLTGSFKRTDNSNDAAGSVTWTSITLPGGQYPTDVEPHPTNVNIVYASAGNKVYKSTDKGSSWTDISGNLPSLPINCLVYDKNSNEGIYIGNQTSVWYKDATMTNWALFSNGLPPADVRELEIYYDANVANNRIKAGTYGRGVWQSDLATINVIDPTNFAAFVASSSQINLSWNKNAANDDVILAWSPTGTFGQPVDGTAYSAGSSLPGGGTVLYTGGANNAPHTGLNPSTTYYYKIWSVNGSSQYSAGLLPISATTDCQAISAFPYTCSFDNTDCWTIVDYTGNRSWQFGSTTNSNNPPTILTAPYAYFRSTAGATVNFNSDLISPPLNLSALSSVILKFNQHYDGDATWASIARVYYTTDNGLNWNLLATYTTDQNNTPVTILVPGAAGQSNVKFKWNYFDDAIGSYMWGIDDVQVMECSGIWTGYSSTNWHTASNWCNNTVPTATTDVIIPGGVTNMPDISTTATAYCRDITIQAGATLKMSAASSVLEVKGNWNMYGSFDFTNSATTSMVKFNGSSSQIIGGSANTRVRGFTIDNASGITLSAELRAETNIQLTNGIVTTTGSGKIYDVYNVTVRTHGWVNGTLQKYLWAGNGSVENRTFQIGDATSYAPVLLSFPVSSITGTGPISMKTTSGDHPNISSSTMDGNLSVNRYWSFPAMVSFTSCSATLNFVSGDLDAGAIAGNLNAGQYKSGTWSYPYVGTKTVTSVQVTGLASTTLGDLQLAEPASAIDWANLQGPTSGTIDQGNTFNVYARVYEPGVTPGAGAGAGIQCWIGYSTTNSDPSTWTNWLQATYNTDDGNNDEYVANIGAAITSPGTYYYASRFKRGSSAYVYGGYNSGGGNFWDGTSYISGVLIVNALPTSTIFTAASGNWNTPGNWSNGVPTASLDAIIDGDATVDVAANTKDLTINSGKSVTISNGKSLTVNGSLTNSAGVAGLVLESGGSLIESSGAEATVKRGITANAWHFISSPVSSAVSGIFINEFLMEHSAITNNYTYITGTSVPLVPVKGYAIYADNGAIEAVFDGNLNSGYQSYNTVYGGSNLGWNLVGNPYPSYIDWDASAGWTKTSVNNAIYIENGSSSWTSYVNGIGANLGSQYIAPCQGFFVEVSGNGVLGMNNQVRTHNTASYFKHTEETYPSVRLQISGNSHADETVIYLYPGSTSGFDGNADAHKLFGDEPGAAQIYSSGTTPLSINALPEPVPVTVGVRAEVSGTYTIAATEINDLTDIKLEDTKTGTLTPLANKAYTFNWTAGEAEERFVLHFSTIGMPEPSEVSANIYSYEKTVYVNLPVGVKGDITVFNLTGQVVNSRLSVTGQCRLTLPVTGIYTVRVVTGKETVSQKVFIK